MPENKHTPGPWKIEIDSATTKGATDYVLRDANKKYLGNLAESSDDSVLQARGWLPVAEADANARLIAAAPDLLAACEQAYSLIGVQWVGPSLDVSNRLRDAIAKAKG